MKTLKKIWFNLTNLKQWNMFRVWLMQKVFTDDEKYLIKRAIDDRIECLEKIKIMEKWADPENIKIDVRDYKKINWIFSTDSWN